MATDLSQDAVLRFLRSSGGSVKNSDLLLHFRNFIRNHADRDRNRELFKRFVNSVATVRQEDGVSYVVLRKKFKGHVPGDDGGDSSGPRSSSTDPNPAVVSAEKPWLKPQLREATTPAQPGDPAKKTILPAAGIILNNNNNINTNFNLKRKQQQQQQQQQQVNSTSGLSGGAAAAHSSSLSEPPAQQRPESGPLPGITPVVPVERHHGQPSQQVSVPQTLRNMDACQQPEGNLHQEPPLQNAIPHTQIAPRRFRYRPSYKTAVSHDDDSEEEEEEDEEEEEVAIRRGSAGGVWPPRVPLEDTIRAISASSPCIIESPAPASVLSSSSSSSSERNPPPKIYIQDVEGLTLPPRDPPYRFESGVERKGQWAGTGLDQVYVSEDPSPTRHSRPLEAERHTPSPDRVKGASPHHDVHQDHRYSQASGVQLEPQPHESQRARLSSSHSSIFSSSDAGFSSNDWPPSGSSRGSGWNSSYEDLQTSAGDTRRGSKIQEALQRVQRTKSVTSLTDSETTAGRLQDDQHLTAHLSPFHHLTDHLHDNRDSTLRVTPWHLSTGDLSDSHDEAESSEGSSFSSPLRPHAVARQLGSQLRSRMCRSLGADLDQLLQEEEARVGGSEAARLNRLHLISSSLCLRYNLSSSSLSSCSTPSRSHSLANLVEGVEQRGTRKSQPTATTSSTAQHEAPSKQSSVPLDPREHAWLVKGAAGVWPDIYSLFREDPSLLNKQDFISGFTVLHWIAKHGDHRVLNTLWYGVQKAGLMFNINARSSCGYTPLHVAAIHGNKNIMRLLVNKFEADVKLRDVAGKKPWQYLSSSAPMDVFQMLGAPARAALGGGGGDDKVRREDASWQQQQQQHRRRRRHHFSTASSGERPLTIAGTIRVKRSSSIAALLKHKSLRRFHGQNSDSSV